MYRRGVEANINAKSIHALRRTVSSKLNSRLPSATGALIMGHTEEVNQTHYNYDIMELTIKKIAMEQICAISIQKGLYPTVSKKLRDKKNAESQ